MDVRRFLLVLLLAAGVLVVPPLPRATACSCAAWPDASELLPQAEAAFVGALLSRDEDPPPVKGVFWSGTLVRHHYQVEQAVKGDISTGTIDVWGTTDGASCGLGTPVGQRIGLLLRREGDRWLSGLCSIADPDNLVRSAQAPPRSETVVPAVLAGSVDGRDPDRRPLVVAAGASLLAGVAAYRSVRRRRAPKPTVL